MGHKSWAMARKPVPTVARDFCLFENADIHCVLSSFMLVAYLLVTIRLSIFNLRSASDAAVPHFPPSDI